MDEQNKSKKGTGWVIALIVLIIIVAIIMIAKPSASSKKSQNATTSSVTTASTSYVCKGGKTINATFNTSSTTLVTNPGIPPNPSGSVALKLSDGRDMTLPQVLSADGVRFATSDGTTVFWNVGNGASLYENGTTTYSDCISTQP